MYNLDKLEEADCRLIDFIRNRDHLGIYEACLSEYFDFDFLSGGVRVKTERIEYMGPILLLEYWEKTKIKVEKYLYTDIEGLHDEFSVRISDGLEIHVTRAFGKDESLLEAWLSCKCNFEINIYKFLKFFGGLTVKDEKKYNELTTAYNNFLERRPAKLKAIKKRELAYKNLLKEEIELYKRMLKLQIELEENKFIANYYGC